MDFNEYQDAAAEFAQYPEAGTGSMLALAYTGLGLGEAGEVQGKIKKVLRDDHGVLTARAQAAIISELGDVLWYVAACARELGVDLDDIAQANVDKLSDRAERATIGGSGDNR